MSEGATPSIGLIGLGNMGVPMTQRLIGAGYRVIGYDVSPEARQRAVDAGAAVATSAAECAQAVEILILMLPDSAVVTDVVGGLLDESSLRDGCVVVDMSSSEPSSTRALAEQLRAARIRMVDAPVSGGVKGAVGGTLTIMVGGDDNDVTELTPIFETLGRPVRAGAIGAGHAVKALNNLLSATHLWITGEAIEAGRRFGLDTETMLAIFNGSSGRSGSTENKWPNFVLPGTFDSGFGLRLMLKDMRIAVGIAEQNGLPSRLGACAVDLWDEAAEGMDPGADHTEIARWIRDRTNE